MSQLTHQEILNVKRALPDIQRFGGRSLSPEIPLAIRIRDVHGHDDFLAAISGLPLKTIQEIDQAVIRNRAAGRPTVVRYFLDDREHGNPEDFKKLAKAYENSVVTHIPANSYGKMPLVVPGSSVVFHSRVFHNQSILGQLNPGLVNSNIAQILTANKYVESLFWQQYAPEALPETHLLSKMNLNLANPQKLVEQLNHKFPQGWVMKGVNESATNFSIITDQTKLAQEIEAYQKSDFEKFKAATYQRLVGYDDDDIYTALQEHKNYFGWRASQYLNSPERVIVQRKVDIDREFRVEAINGKILRKATIDRHNWWLEMKNLPFQQSAPETFKKVEDFAQSLVDKLPPHLRETNFAFDIALLKNGNYIAIESNAGSECGFLPNLDISVAALNEYLLKLPELKNEGQVTLQGLSGIEQMKYLQEHFKTWGIDPSLEYPQYQFLKSELKTQFKSVEVAKKFRSRATALLCSQVHH